MDRCDSSVNLLMSFRGLQAKSHYASDVLRCFTMYSPGSLGIPKEFPSFLKKFLRKSLGTYQAFSCMSSGILWLFSSKSSRGLQPNHGFSPRVLQAVLKQSQPYQALDLTHLCCNGQSLLKTQINRCQSSKSSLKYASSDGFITSFKIERYKFSKRGQIKWILT